MKTLLRLRSFPLRSGDKILFERGSVFRTEDPIFLSGGIFLGAYGNGEKPIILGSLHNYEKAKFWEQGEYQHHWILTTKIKEVGCVTFNGDTEIGVRKNKKEDMAKNGDFYYDFEMGTLELYYDNGNPGENFSDIEIATAKDLIYGINVNGVHIDNLCLKYATCLAITFGNSRDIHITNCVLGWIGGAYFTTGVRYGNAIQFWHRGENIVVEYCYMYQIFDAALTFQGKGIDKSFFKEVRFENNLIEYSSMNFEFWLGEQGKMHQ